MTNTTCLYLTLFELMSSDSSLDACLPFISMITFQIISIEIQLHIANTIDYYIQS